MKKFTTIAALILSSVAWGCDSKPSPEALRAEQEFHATTQNVLNGLDNQLTCQKMKKDLLNAGDSERQIKHALAATGYNLDCIKAAR